MAVTHYWSLCHSELGLGSGGLALRLCKWSCVCVLLPTSRAGSSAKPERLGNSVIEGGHYDRKSCRPGSPSDTVP